MKVTYFSYGADNSGEYEVIDKDIPRTLLGTQNDGQISLQEAAEMALSHSLDDGSFEVIEGPSKPHTVRASEQYVVTFSKNGRWDIEVKLSKSFLEKRKARLEKLIEAAEKEISEIIDKLNELKVSYELTEDKPPEFEIQP